MMYRLYYKSSRYYQQLLYHISSIIHQYVITSIDYTIKWKQLVVLFFHVTKGKVFYFLHLIKVTIPAGRHSSRRSSSRFIPRLYQWWFYGDFAALFPTISSRKNMTKIQKEKVILLRLHVKQKALQLVFSFFFPFFQELFLDDLENAICKFLFYCCFKHMWPGSDL